MTTLTIALFAVAYVLMGAALAGWVTFRVLYKPWTLRGHSKTGRHLIRTADSMMLLLGVSIVQAVVPMPLEVAAGVTVLVLFFLAWVAWERVVILRRERAARRAREQLADLEDTA